MRHDESEREKRGQVRRCSLILGFEAVEGLLVNYLALIVASSLKSIFLHVLLQLYLPHVCPISMPGH